MWPQGLGVLAGAAPRWLVHRSLTHPCSLPRCKRHLYWAGGAFPWGAQWGLFFFFFFRLHLQLMGVPELGDKSELQPRRHWI